MKHSILAIFIAILSIFQSSAVEVNNDRYRFCESDKITAHKYYLSVSNVKYNEKVRALQMTSRFFIDDLEDVLSARADEEIILTEEGSLEKYKKLLGDYFKSRMRVKVDDNLIPIEYLGAEVENDQLVLYVEIPALKEPSQIEMRFTALLELFEEQKNMVHFKIKGKRKTILTTIDKKIDSVKF